MNPRILPHLAWLLVVVIAYGIGYSGRSDSGAKVVTGTALPTTPWPEQAVASVQTSASGIEERGGVAAPAALASGDPMQLRTFQTLSIGNRLQRMRALCDLMPSINKANWREVLNGVSRSTQSQGRSFNDTAEYHMLLEQIGEVAGTEALTEALNSKRRDTHEMLTSLLKGVASRDPKAVEDWYGQLPADQQAGMQEQVIWAIAAGDPAKSIEMAFSTNKSMQDRLFPAAMNEAFQQGGFAAGERILDGVRARSDVTDASKGWLFMCLAERRIQMNAESGAPLETLIWVESYIGQPFIGPNATKEMITSAAQSDPAKTMTWLEQHSAAMTQPQTEAAYAAMASAWEGQDPGALSAWLSSHTDSPQHDRLAGGAAMQALRANRIQDAQELMQQMTDPAARAPLEAALERRQTMPR